jgi:transposase
MGRFITGADGQQTTLFPPCVDDWIDGENPVRAVDAFVDALDLAEVALVSNPLRPGGRPNHPSVLLKLYIYCYLNQVQSSRRLEREAKSQRRADVAGRSACARPQDHRRLPP